MTEALIGPETLVPITTITPALVHTIVTRIVNAVDPVSIILFGSYAYGTPHKESDVDLLVILDTALPRHKRTIKINQALAGLLIPKDILVHTPEEGAEWKGFFQAVIAQITTKGVVVYNKNNPRPGIS
ncbi:MAG: nucleotidyltransferase domain-containing protein [Methanoregula sp.]